MEVKGGAPKRKMCVGVGACDFALGAIYTGDWIPSWQPGIAGIAIWREFV